jgi:hypothetical protein
MNGVDIMLISETVLAPRKLISIISVTIASLIATSTATDGGLYVLYSSTSVVVRPCEMKLHISRL